MELRSGIAAPSRAKIVYEYLMQFTDDPRVQETLRFLMTREIAHFMMFQAALETIQSNFPRGVLQGDPRYAPTYFNLSNGASARGPWNEGQGTWGDGHPLHQPGEVGLIEVTESDDIPAQTGAGKRMSRLGKLAEGEELWSNTLNVIFQRFSITYDLMDWWRRADSPMYPGGASARPATRPSILTSSCSTTPTSWCTATPLPRHQTLPAARIPC